MGTPAEVNLIIHCEDGAVIKFVNRMYEALTQRTLKKVSRRLLPAKPQAFTRETGSTAIRACLRGAMLAETSDETTQACQLAERVGLHEQSLQEERSLEPDRFHFVRASNARGGPMRASARVVDAEAAAAPKVTVKAIQVRQVDKTITRPRGRDESSVSMDLHVSALSQTTPRPPVSGDGISTTSMPSPIHQHLSNLQRIMQKLFVPRRLLQRVPALWVKRLHLPLLSRL